jgi:hypothetical protein
MSATVAKNHVLAHRGRRERSSLAAAAVKLPLVALSTKDATAGRFFTVQLLVEDL